MRPLNAARVHVSAASGWIRSPGVGEVASPFPWGPSARLDVSPSCSRNHLLGDGQLLSFLSVKWRIPELGPEMKETGPPQPKTVMELLR